MLTSRVYRTRGFKDTRGWFWMWHLSLLVLGIPQLFQSDCDSWLPPKSRHTLYGFRTAVFRNMAAKTNMAPTNGTFQCRNRLRGSIVFRCELLVFRSVFVDPCHFVHLKLPTSSPRVSKKRAKSFLLLRVLNFPKQKSGNLIWSNYNDFTRPGPLKGSWGREIRRNLGWCILIWPDMMVDFFIDMRQHYFLFGNSCKQFKYGMTVWYQWCLCTFWSTKGRPKPFAVQWMTNWILFVEPFCDPEKMYLFVGRFAK